MSTIKRFLISTELVEILKKHMDPVALELAFLHQHIKLVELNTPDTEPKGGENG